MNGPFEREIRLRLREEFRRRPFMEQRDAVKFVFQAMLGAGHLLSDRDAVTERAAREMEGLTPDPAEPLFEILSPGWCRMNLRRARAEGIPPQAVAGLMKAGAPSSPRYTRREVYGFCRELAASGDALFADAGALEAILDGNWLPSHSSAYREAARPAYRVISADWIPCMETVRAIAARQAEGNRPLVTIDGPCASGKTTLAGRLAEVFRAPVIHTDDFVVPHAQKTPERLGVPGGNCDWERLVREVVAPWKRGGPVRYRRYDCGQDCLLPEEELPDCGILILEGSYCNLPAIRERAGVRIFADAPWEIRQARLLRRESPESLRRFYERWIPLEDAYFRAYKLPDADCLIVR